MGDLINTTLTPDNPIQLLPRLNLQGNIQRLGEDPSLSVGNDIISHLHELLIFLENPVIFPNRYYPASFKHPAAQFNNINKPLDMNLIYNLFNQLPSEMDNGVINIIMKDIFCYPGFDALINLLKTKNCRKKYLFHYCCSATSNQINTLIEDKSTGVIYVDFPIKEEEFLSSFQWIKKEGWEYAFLISSAQEMELADELIEKYQLSHYSLIPIVTRNNLSFLKEYMYLAKQDILSSPIPLREIFIHQSMNVETFGKLALIPDGNIYSNIFSNNLGNIQNNKLIDLLYQEFKYGNSWFHIRSQSPCSQCHFQWLCPSPSCYESLLGVKNLCDIKK